MSPAANASAFSADHRPAYGAGVFAAVVTLALGSVVLTWLGWIGTTPILSLEAGDCLEFVDGEPAALRPLDCSRPHAGEVAGIATHPDSGRPFPGSEVTRVWFEEQCRSVITEYLGADHLATTLNAGIALPTEDDWDDGVHHAVCYVTVDEGAELLAESVQGRSGDFARGDVVPIDRLMAGDCFVPTGSDDPFGLRSSDTVELTDCSASFVGMFFGRGILPFPDGAPIPTDTELTDSSTTTCSAEFESFFGVESAIGYTFRFWRPSQSKWDGGDREVLCAVLSDEPIDGPFLPADYPELHKLGTGQCFNLLPEQTAASLTLDDHVRPSRCSQVHAGQMIGGATFDPDLRFPGLDQTKALAQAECRSLFEVFIGVEPVESEFGRFPYWYPDEEAWAAGDTRYACAIIGDNLSESLQDSRR